jgi:hypothetical protein
LLTSSTDEGQTWSAPVKVNDTAGAQGAFTPTVKVDSNGRVGVLYYDLRNDASARDGTFTTTEWIALSTDGGHTFAPSRRVALDFDHAAAANAGGFPRRLPGAWRERDEVPAVLRGDSGAAG